jgi:salicylate hydroxylase
MGVEDALVLAGVLERAQEIIRNKSDTTEKRDVLKAAFEAYDTVRRERSQWLVASSRRQGQLVKGEVPGIGRDRAGFVKDTNERVKKIYEFEGKSAAKQAVNALEATVSGS